MKIENISVANMEAALRGMRNPMNSWSKSTPEADVELGRKLASAGATHGKFLRMITITCDITAPLYWWKEFDTYKVGTVANSCSTMHTLMNKPFEISDFETDDIYIHYGVLNEPLRNIVDGLNNLRNKYFEYRQLGNEELAKKYWRTIIAMLPSGYLQKRTVMLNYEVLRRIVKDRAGHKLKEWQYFIESMSALPYYTEFILGKTGEECMKESVEKIFRKCVKENSEKFNSNSYMDDVTTKNFNNFALDISYSKKTESLYEETIQQMIDKMKTQEEVKNDAINPGHYKSSTSIECIEAMLVAFGSQAVLDFCLCNAWKYMWRHKHKNGLEDLKKAKWYINSAWRICNDYEDTVIVDLDRMHVLEDILKTYTERYEDET